MFAVAVLIVVNDVNTSATNERRITSTSSRPVGNAAIKNIFV